MGNYKELRIHMDGLQRMVYMRGGLHELGWGHILHMFISWYFIPLPWLSVENGWIRRKRILTCI